MIALSLLLLTQTAPIDQYLSRGDYPAALKAAQALPAEAKTRYEGLIALRQGRSHAAVKAFSKALQLAPAAEQLRLFLAEAHLIGGAPEAALSVLAKVDSLRTSMPAFHLLKANALEKLKRNAERFSVLKRAAQKLFPENVLVHLSWLEACIDLGLLQQAREIAETLAKRSLSKDEVHHTLIYLQGVRGTLPTAEILAAQHSRSPRVRLQLGQNYWALGHPRVAAKLFSSTLALGSAGAEKAAAAWQEVGAFAKSRQAARRIPDPGKRNEALAASYFAEGQYAQVLRLLPPPATIEGRYRRAYAAYAVGEQRTAAQILNTLPHGALGGAGERLREALSPEALR